MIDNTRQGHHVHIRPGVHIGARRFLPDEEGTITEEHTHDTGRGETITLVRWANNEIIPMYPQEITEEVTPC